MSAHMSCLYTPNQTHYLPLICHPHHILSTPSVYPLPIDFFTGVLLAGSSVKNSVKGKSERIGRMLQMHANERTEVGD